MIPNLRRLGLAPPSIALAATLTFSGLGLGEGLIYQSIPLEILLDVGLILTVSIVVAVVSLRSFLTTGSVNILLLGTAVLSFGAMATFGGSVRLTDAGLGLTVYTLGTLTSGGFHFSSAVLTLRGSPTRSKHLLLRAGTCYGGTVLFLGMVSLLVYESVIPSIFGAPGTILGEASAIVSVVLFGVSAVMFSIVYLRSRSKILYWYSLGLWASALGFSSFLDSNLNGDLLFWTGIASLCLGSLYFLFSVLAVPKSPSTTKSSELMSRC